MTDREPLRVGPLVLKWATDRKDVTGAELRDAYECPLANGGWIELFDEDKGRGHVFVSYGGAVILFDRTGPIDRCLSAAKEHLTETGYLAQYRSRRRLLARECERRAEHWKRLHRHSEQRVCEVATWADRQEWRRFAASDRARAAKYARWANQLKDSP